MEALSFLIRFQKEYESHLITCVDSLIFSVILNPSFRLSRHSFLNTESEGKRNASLTYLTDLQ